MGICLWLQDTAGTVQDKAQGAAGATQDKTNQAGGVAGEKWEQTKQAASGTTQAAQDKAQDAKKATGGFMQQVVFSIRICALYFVYQVRKVIWHGRI